MDKQEQKSMASWVASVTSSMGSIEQFGHATLEVMDELVAVLKDHEQRLVVIEHSFQSLLETIGKFVEAFGFEPNE
tara:strand:+ start:221 stop:448 length:228 start_codon:yes stop_codon:yes gene_type:complete